MFATLDEVAETGVPGQWLYDSWWDPHSRLAADDVSSNGTT